MTDTTTQGAAVEYDESTGTYRATHDWRGDRSLTTTLVMAVSTITDTPATELEPIHRVIDADALDGLLSPRRNAEPRYGGSSVSFRFQGCDVTVRSSGAIEIERRDGDDAERNREYR